MAVFGDMLVFGSVQQTLPLAPLEKDATVHLAQVSGWKLFKNCEQPPLTQTTAKNKGFNQQRTLDF